MSNFAPRQRRTVPLEDDEEGESSVPEGSRHRSSSHVRLSAPSPGSSRSRSRRKRIDASVSSRGLQPIRQSFSNDGNNESRHSRQSASSVPSISTGELKRSLYEKRQSSRTPSAGTKTPSQRSNPLTIGNSSILSSSRSLLQATTPLPLTGGGGRHSSTSSSQTPRSALPDLFSLEQALNDCGDEDLDKFMKKEETKRKSSITKTPVGWKTPFEVDAPRETPRRNSTLRTDSPPPASVVSEPDPLWSEEQDAWAGIDELLETKSMDDSFCFSTSDILPRATVRAMRRDQSVRSLGETIAVDEADHSEGGEYRNSKRSLESISKNSSGSSSHSRIKGATRRSKTSEGDLDSLDKSEANDKVPELLSNIARKNGRAAPEKRNVEGTTSSGGLFDMFHWSEKDNVDEQRGRKTKLNRKPTGRRVKLVTNSNHGSSNDESDSCSLPSLDSFQPGDFPTLSDHWGTNHSKDLGSVVSDHSRDEFGFDEVEVADLGEEAEPEIAFPPTEDAHSVLSGDGLVLDEGVEEYIKQIQRKLPTIVEDNASSGKISKLKKQIEFADETTPSPTTVTDDSPFDDLPSLASFSNVHNSFSSVGNAERSDGKISRQEEKKEPKQSLSFQLMSSIKKMRSKGKSPKGVVLGDDAKYFPDEAKPEKAKRFGANRCLLSEGGDGVNWD